MDPDRIKVQYSVLQDALVPNVVSCGQLSVMFYFPLMTHHLSHENVVEFRVLVSYYLYREMYY